MKIKLGDICNFEKGQTGIQSAVPGEYPLVVTGPERKSCNTFQFDCEAVCVPLVSSTGHGHKSLNYVHYQSGKFALGTILVALTAKNKDVLNIEYLKEYLFYFKNELLVPLMKGGANVTLSIKSLQELVIDLPDLKKQLQIVQLVHKVKDQVLSIDQNIRFNELNNNKLISSILNESIQGKLLPQNSKDESANKLFLKIQNQKGETDNAKKKLNAISFTPITTEETPFELPKNWTWCRLKDICIKIGSGSTPKGSNYSNEGIPFFRSQNIHNSGLLFTDIKYISNDVHERMKGTTVYPNDILLNITGGSIGRCALVPNNFKEGNVSQHVCIIRPIGIENEYLHKVILSPYFQQLITNSTTGAGREGLPKYNLEQFLIPLPPIAEQKRILKKIALLISKCEDQANHIEAAKKNINKLVQAVFFSPPKKI